MAGKNEVIGTANLAKNPADSRVDIAWLVAQKWMSSVQLRTPSKPDFAKIIAVMTKAKKPMDFIASFDGQWVVIGSRVGSAVDELSSIDVSDGKDVAKWRAAMLRLKAGSKLVSDEDLKKFDKDHPDPEKIKLLNEKLSKVDGELKKLQSDLKAKNDERNLIVNALFALGVKVK